MSQPSTLPTWATDTNIASGTELGTPTKVQPSAPYVAQGLVPGLTFIGPYFNWLINVICLWLAYLKNLDTDAYFLGRTYAWTGSHSFANRPAYAAPVSRSSALMLHDAKVWDRAEVPALDANFKPQFDSPSPHPLSKDFKVPVGGTLTGVTVQISQSPGATATLDLYRITGTSQTCTKLNASSASFTGGTVSLSLTSPTDFTADVPADSTSYVVVVSTTDTTGAAVWTSARAQWTDPGFIGSAAIG